MNIAAIAALISALAGLLTAISALRHSVNTRNRLWAHRTTPLNDHQQPYRPRTPDSRQPLQRDRTPDWPR